MADIFFKCDACGKPLIADEAGAGLTITCPDCQGSLTIPRILLIHDCPYCRVKVKASTEMKGELVTCPACQGEFPIPGQASHAPHPEPSVDLICPNCRAEVEAPALAANQTLACPNCGDRVHFRRKLHMKTDASQAVIPPQPLDRKKSWWRALLSS